MGYNILNKKSIYLPIFGRGGRRVWDMDIERRGKIFFLYKRYIYIYVDLKAVVTNESNILSTTPQLPKTSTKPNRLTGKQDISICFFFFFLSKHVTVDTFDYSKMLFLRRKYSAVSLRPELNKHSFQKDIAVQKFKSLDLEKTIVSHWKNKFSSSITISTHSCSLPAVIVFTCLGSEDPCLLIGK